MIAASLVFAAIALVSPPSGEAAASISGEAAASIGGEAATPIGGEEAAPPSRELLLELTQTARLAGTSGGEWGAEIVARRLAEAGFEVELDRREVLLSLPRELELALYEDGFATRPFLERLDVFDPDRNPPGDVPPFSAWSPSGDVRGRVVDVGYGLEEDYARLAALNVKVEGAIVLARYGRAYRGAKVDVASRHGAVGVLLFSDPSDDGAQKGPTWPEGPWKPDWAVQRGSISPMGRAPGDPTTPGWPSPAPGMSARRLAGEELAPALPKIPCLPIPAREAAAIQAKLRGVRGADGETRPLGPGSVEARLRLVQDPELRPIVNVIGRLAGREESVVIAGTHRDAWVRGANDSGGGVVGLLRAAQRFGADLRAGEHPRSTVVLAFWDAEEQSLIGSTEWAEANEAWLARSLVAYVNADAAVGGTHMRRLGGTPGLLGATRRALERVAAASGAPEGVATLWDELESAAREREREVELSLPGSGSDFTVFLHHLGLPVLDIGLSGSGGGGQYHTRYDDFPMVERYIDPGFVGHELLGELVYALLSELSSSGLDAFDTAEMGRALAARARAAGAEGEKPAESDAEGEDGDPAEDAATAAWLGAERGERLARAFERLAASESAPRDVYRSLRLPEGLEGRAWYRGPLWTADPHNGYGTETFPTLRAAARENDAALEDELARLVAALDALSGESEPAVTPAPATLEDAHRAPTPAGSPGSGG